MKRNYLGPWSPGGLNKPPRKVQNDRIRDHSRFCFEKRETLTIEWRKNVRPQDAFFIKFLNDRYSKFIKKYLVIITAKL